ncbi:MAG: glycosyltransferase, partial [Hyphococcus sp.]
EGLPVVIMEALALGRPVISTYIAGIPELVDDGCGWIIPAGDEDALIAAMRAAMTAAREALEAKGSEGRARVERDHDVDKEAAKLHALFSGGERPGS